MLKSRSRRARTIALTLVEVVVAVAVLAIVTVGMTHSMLVMNRNASLSRVKNIAKAIVLGRIHEVSATPYNPAASPLPSFFILGTRTENVALQITDAGSIPATLKWTVANARSGTTIRSVTCRMDYQYLGREQNYEVVTFRSPD